MMVASVAGAGRGWSVTSEGYVQTGTARHDSAEIDPMQGALIAFSGKATGEGAAPFAGWQRRDAVPFDAAHRYMATLDQGSDGQRVIHVKGAP